MYQATGLNVTDVITASNSNAVLTNTVPDQSETFPTDTHEHSSVLHSSDTDNEACAPETLSEDTKETGSPTIEDMQDIDGSSPAVDNPGESNCVMEDTINKSNPENADKVGEVHQAEDTISNNILQEKDAIVAQEGTVTKDTVQEEDAASIDNVTTQKGDKKVRFNLQDTENKEDSTFTQNTLQSVIAAANSELVTSGNSETEFVSSTEVSFTMSPEQVKQLGYTQLRELKCSLETKLGCKFEIVQ